MDVASESCNDETSELISADVPIVHQNDAAVNGMDSNLYKPPPENPIVSLDSASMSDLETHFGASCDHQHSNGDSTPSDELEQEVNYLRERNEQLERKVKHMKQLLALDDYLPEEMDNPIALVIVPDNPRARHYKEQIEEFLSSLPPMRESRIRRNKKADEYDPLYQPSSFNLYSLLESTDHRSKDKVRMIYNSFVAHSEYLVDSCGQPLMNFDSALTDGWNIPSFSQSWLTSLGDEEAPTRTKKFQMTCFNCGGPHNLKECREKRDLVRISQNRQALMDKFGAAPGLAAKSTRYHMETSQVDKRFARFFPGVVSKDLREALRLPRYSLPKFTYRMRQLGYPPGWLKEAEVESSGLDIIQDDPEFTEDGEVAMDIERPEKSVEVTYNMDKLVNFPGFNSKLPDGTLEECNKMRPAMPPMQRHQQLAVWCVFLASKRTAASQEEDGPPPSKRRSCTVETDMDITENEPVMPIIRGEEEDNEHTAPPLPLEPFEPHEVILEEMPLPPSFTHWWTKSLKQFIIPDCSSYSDSEEDDVPSPVAPDDDQVTVTTIEDTVKLLRSSEKSKSSEPSNPPTASSDDPSSAQQRRRRPFKITSDMRKEVIGFRRCSQHLDLSNVLFPDRSEPESIAHISDASSPIVQFIQDGGSDRFVSAKGLPEYWKFSSGIEPYEAIEELPTLGLYTKIIQTLKQHGKWK